MKKLFLTSILLFAALVNYANSLKVINTTGCKYNVVTDGGSFSIEPFTALFFVDPSSIGGYYYDLDFHVVKVYIDPLDVVDVAEFGPFVNTSSLTYLCNGGGTFSVKWSWAGPDVLITIF